MPTEPESLGCIRDEPPRFRFRFPSGTIDHREKLLDLIFSDKVNIDKVSVRPRDETRRYVHSCRRFERSGVCRVDSY